MPRKLFSGHFFCDKMKGRREKRGMTMQAHSIFNDILGPIMAGPSSSHSAGCARIGRQVRLLWGKDIKKAVVVYDSHGSYPSTCVGQGSNFGFTGGLLGLGNDDPRMKDSEAMARAMGADITFRVEPLSARHPNEARIDVYDEDGRIGLSALTLSTGGGMFEIVELDGFPVYINGSREMILAICASSEAAVAAREKLTTCAKNIETVKNEKGIVLLCASGLSCTMEEAEGQLVGLHGIGTIRKAPVVLPVPMKSGAMAPFETASEMIAYAAQSGKALWELAIDYECALGDITPDGVVALGQRTLEVMRAAAQAPDPANTPMYGFLPYQSRTMMEKVKDIPTVDCGWLNKAMFYALSVMENSCAHNIVSAAPTAGSSGVVPAAVVAVGEEMGLSDETIVHGLLAAGLAGACIANRATFGAEVAGCQAENGAASAMAACGIIQLLGGTVRQGMDAASLALQNLLGLICDPIGGLTEIPCISRNVTAMSNAVLSANMTMLGFDQVIPFDETVETMLRVGRQLPAALRCTCGGGLCLTPTACQIVKNLK